MREKPILMVQITDILIEGSGTYSLRREMNNSLFVQGQIFERVER